MSIPLVLPTALFALTVVTVVVAVVEFSGFFPRASRPEELQRPSGSLLIGLLGLALLGLAAAGLWLAVSTLPWTTAIIAGGLALLFAPLVFQCLPREFWDSRAGAATATVACIIPLLLIVLAQGEF